MVRPFFSKEFFPTEVKSIRENTIKPYDFQNAQIVGAVSPRGEEEVEIYIKARNLLLIVQLLPNMLLQ